MVALEDIKKFAPNCFDNDDYAAISFTAEETSYRAGTNANAAATSSWSTGQAAKRTLFYATQNCWIRFNADDRVQHYIPAETYIWFYRRWHTIYVVRDTVDGTLRCWMEG